MALFTPAVRARGLAVARLRDERVIVVNGTFGCVEIEVRMRTAPLQGSLHGLEALS
jgi:hypothetical protein